MALDLILFWIALLCFLLLSLSLVLGVLRHGAPPMPSSTKLRNAVLDALLTLDRRSALPPGALFDIGSGWGGMARRLARHFPDRAVIGIEPLWVPYCVSVTVRFLFGPENLQFRYGYARADDAAQAGATVLYLGPKATQTVAPMFLGKCLLVSAFFKIAGAEPEFVVEVDDLMRSSVFVYGEVCNPHR